jgi:hypothetical protein
MFTCFKSGSSVHKFLVGCCIGISAMWGVAPTVTHAEPDIPSDHFPVDDVDMANPVPPGEESYLGFLNDTVQTLFGRPSEGYDLALELDRVFTGFGTYAGLSQNGEGFVLYAGPSATFDPRSPIYGLTPSELQAWNAQGMRASLVGAVAETARGSVTVIGWVADDAGAATSTFVPAASFPADAAEAAVIKNTIVGLASGSLQRSYSNARATGGGGAVDCMAALIDCLVRAFDAAIRCLGRAFHRCWTYILAAIRACRFSGPGIKACLAAALAAFVVCVGIPLALNRQCRNQLKSAYTKCYNAFVRCSGNASSSSGVSSVAVD